MAKLNFTVQNDVDNVKLIKNEQKKVDKKEKKVKKVKTNGKSKGNFFKNVLSELKLVTWPTRKSIVKYTFTTLLMIIVFATVFMGIAILFDLLYGLVQGWVA